MYHLCGSFCGCQLYCKWGIPIVVPFLFSSFALFVVCCSCGGGVSGSMFLVGSVVGSSSGLLDCVCAGGVFCLCISPVGFLSPLVY